jgi:hypothetical protein
MLEGAKREQTHRTQAHAHSLRSRARRWSAPAGGGFDTRRTYLEARLSVSLVCLCFFFLPAVRVVLAAGRVGRKHPGYPLPVPQLATSYVLAREMAPSLRRGILRSTYYIYVE